MEGLTFQPRPRYLAAFWPVPVVAIPPLPFSPVKFSGEIERVWAPEVRYRVESVPDRPSWPKLGKVRAAPIAAASKVLRIMTAPSFTF